MLPPTYIATARLDGESAGRLTRLRERYFPLELNYLAAHVTLFHRLAPDAIAILEACVHDAFEVTLAAPFSLGRGVAIRVESARLVALRDGLAARLPGLSAQDRQGYRPHVTIQNKVTAAEARACLEEVRNMWRPMMAMVEGIDIWEYLGGPWRHHDGTAFRA